MMNAHRISQYGASIGLSVPFLVFWIIASLVATGFLKAQEFPPVYNSEPSAEAPRAAEQVAEQMKVPDGFTVTVFANEPEVQNPIAMSWDSKGRLWVAENYTYAERDRKFALDLQDRVIVLEDEDGDGKAEKRTVFADNLQILTSIEIGKGGVWLMAPPNLLFIPDADEDGIPDGPAQTVLNGFDVGLDSHHNFANGLKWGPDGWLYGRVGHSCPGLVGAPNCKDQERVPVDGGIWRYSVETRVFEALCHGTVNPWGHDWDSNGELFFVNTVIGHLWHMMPGAHFIESFGESSNPGVYQRLDMIADHYHFDKTGSWTESRDGRANEFGGGHAHSGAAICLDARWPKAYQGKLFTINLHGLRANVERLERSGSGYVGKHEPDLFVVPDRFFRGIDLNFGPDGALYVSDWSDTGECHDSTGVHRTSGRIYRIAPPKLTQSDELTVSKPWCLQGQGRLPRLWQRYQVGQVGQDELLNLLNDPDEHVRVWAIRLLTDRWPLDTIMGPKSSVEYPAECQTIGPKLVSFAKQESSGLVLSVYASTLQRSPVSSRAELATALIEKNEFSHDERLQNLVWYGLIPVAEQFPEELASLITHTRWRLLQEYIARNTVERSAERSARSLGATNAMRVVLREAARLDSEGINAVLKGFEHGVRGLKPIKLGDDWETFTQAIAGRSDERLRQHLDAYMGAGPAIEDLIAIVQNSKAEMRARQQALETLRNADYEPIAALCFKLLDTRVLNLTAAQVLSEIDSKEVGLRLARKYRQFQPEDRSSLLDILCSRRNFAAAMLETVALANSTIPLGDLTLQHAMKIRLLDDPELNTALEKVWGDARETLPSHQETISRLKKFLEVVTEEQLVEGQSDGDQSVAEQSERLRVDLVQGRRLFDRHCSQCHQMYGFGKAIGPDLTGTQRKDLDYLLTNIVDPSATVGKDYYATIVRTTDGRTLSGLLVKESDGVLVLQTGSTQHTLSKAEIDDRMQSKVSAMPEGLLDGLTMEQIRDLIGYLQHPTQIRLP